MNQNVKGSLEPSSILDSKHIIASPTISLYDIKVVECGDYIQVYYYKNKHTRKKLKVDDTDLNLKKLDIIEVNNDKKEKKIEDRSIIRSKLMCQRLAKANIYSWKTFVTLTFAENVTDISYANKKLHSFITNVQQVKKDFKYICIPEFQKRGAIHYHLLTNIDILDNSLFYNQIDKPKFKHIKYWNNGFTSVEVIKGDIKKIIGYISKYMTKDIDDRLFSHRRYFYSRNLIKPVSNYINLEDIKEKDFYTKKIQDKDLIYQNSYINPYDKEEVDFLEFLAH